MDERVEANRANWDERTAIHLGSHFYDVDGWLRDGKGPRRWEIDVLGDVSGLRLLHLQCHFGLDTLAWARAGAVVTGLDFSPRAIEAATGLARQAGLGDRASFVCADVYDAAEVLGGSRFDIVYVSLGSLCWLPSVDRWAEQVATLVVPGGRCYVHDGHPVAWALADDGPRIIDTCFEEIDPQVSDESWTYTDGAQPMANARSYAWNHGVGETASALVRHGLVLDWLEEHDWTVWKQFDWLVRGADGRWMSPPGQPRLPLSFSVLAHRPAYRSCDDPR